MLHETTYPYSHRINILKYISYTAPAGHSSAQSSYSSPLSSKAASETIKAILDVSAKISVEDLRHVLYNVMPRITIENGKELLREFQYRNLKQLSDAHIRKWAVKILADSEIVLLEHAHNLGFTEVTLNEITYYLNKQNVHSKLVRLSKHLYAFFRAYLINLKNILIHDKKIYNISYNAPAFSELVL
jgi:hypothetical protein